MTDITPIADLQPPFDDLVAAYRDVYGPDEKDAASFRGTLRKHVTRPGFDGRVAREGDRIVGFAYGFTGRPGQPWRDDMARHLGPERADEWLDGHFGFAQFGVVRSHRRQGIGGRLHDVVIGGITHSHSVLSVYEDNHPALAFYTGRNWIELGRGFVTRLGHGPYVVMGWRRWARARRSSAVVHLRLRGRKPKPAVYVSASESANCWRRSRVIKRTRGSRRSFS